MREAVRTVGVIGGGSAGYISALYLKKTCPDLDVTVIESSAIPVVGVGEATTQPMLRFLHQIMGFPVREFFQQAKPTLKLGIKFVWGTPERDHFNSPFGASNLWDALRHTGDPNNLSLLSMLMEVDKTPFFRTGDKMMAPPIGMMAYHIDNQRFLAYLKSKLPVVGCKHLDAVNTEVRVAARKREVEQLVLADGTTRSFDLYVDCSGFRSLLLGSALGTKFVDYSRSLKTDRAVVGMRESQGNLPPYTTATTMRNGWLWNTPMQQEEHLGYVFSSRHSSDDEAFAELEAQGVRAQNGRVIRFRTGRHEDAWVGNVVGVGNAYAFIEPLESTAIHMILKHLKHLSSKLRKETLDDASIARYNSKLANAWDSLSWFVALHFRFNSKLDTPFWRECQAEADIGGLEEYAAYFHEQGPISGNPEHPLFAALDRDSTFPVFAHDAVMAGCGINEEALRLQPGVHGFAGKFALDQQLVKNALGHRESLAYLEQNESEYREHQGGVVLSRMPQNL